MYKCPMHPEVQSKKAGICPKCGMNFIVLIQKKEKGHENHSEHTSMEENFKKRFFITLPLVLLTIILSVNMQKWFHYSFSFPGRELVLFILGTLVFFIGGTPFFKTAKGELKAKAPAMMTLVAFAIAVGYIFSVAATFIFPGESLYWEISTLISVFLLGHWLEMRAVRGATSSLTELAKLIPPSAHLVFGKNIKDIPTDELKIKDRVLVKPGEKIPIDGIVLEGESSVNESMVTGESKPVLKIKGNKVIGGTLNQDGSLTIEVSKTGSDTAISQIMKLIQDAQNSKPNVQHLADKAAGVLFYIAVVGGLISFVFWFFVFPHGAIFAATIAVAVVVVACPHALGLAIPTVTTITSTLGAKNGILIREMKGLEIARKINYVVFDKTGTLTRGKFGVSNIIVFGSSKFSNKELLKFSASLETNSQHLLAQGIVNEAKKQKLNIPKVSQFKSYPGKGAQGFVDGKKVVLGNKILMQEMGIKSQDLNKKSAGTVVYIGVEGKLEGAIMLADEIREDSKRVVDRLHKLGIRVAMLTGDAKDIASEVSKKLNIDTVFAEVLPKTKVDKIKELQKKGNIVAMVGDGVNDAPSLTQAHVGIAIGVGTDVAVESADIVLMKSDLSDVVKAISLSRKTNSKMVQNLVWATGYNVFAIPTAAGILYPSFGILLRPEWAALLMSASSIIVVLNALLLRKTKL